MKVLFGGLFLIALSFSACSKAPVADNSYYDRANSASKESLRGLDRDTK